MLISNSGYRQVTLLVISTEWFTPYEREPPVCLFSRVEYWRYSSLKNKSQKLKLICQVLNGTLSVVNEFICFKIVGGGLAPGNRFRKVRCSVHWLVVLVNIIVVGAKVLKKVWRWKKIRVYLLDIHYSATLTRLWHIYSFLYGESFSLMMLIFELSADTLREAYCWDYWDKGI